MSDESKLPLYYVAAGPLLGAGYSLFKDFIPSHPARNLPQMKLSTIFGNAVQSSITSGVLFGIFAGGAYVARVARRKDDSFNYFISGGFAGGLVGLKFKPQFHGAAALAISGALFGMTGSFALQRYLDFGAAENAEYHARYAYNKP